MVGRIGEVGTLLVGFCSCVPGLAVGRRARRGTVHPRTLADGPSGVRRALARRDAAVLSGTTRTSLGGAKPSPHASYRHEQRTSRQRNPQPRRTLAALPSGADDSGDATPNTAHKADDNTNSKVERPWTLTMNTPELLDDYKR